ncbi:MAG: AMP-binding protein, partial [Novosphingobium sp.]
MRTSLFLDLVADIAPDRVAVDSMQGRLTYGGMRQQALALAAVLRERDYRNLGFLGVNTPALPVALFGAGYAGMSFAPLNYRLTDERLRA